MRPIQVFLGSIGRDMSWGMQRKIKVKRYEQHKFCGWYKKNPSKVSKRGFLLIPFRRVVLPFTISKG
jgi:hypothetical protein